MQCAQMGTDRTQMGLPWISSECRVMKRVESVVVGEHDVGRVIEKEAEHVVSLFGNGVVQGSVPFRILKDIVFNGMERAPQSILKC